MLESLRFADIRAAWCNDRSPSSAMAFFGFQTPGGVHAPKTNLSYHWHQVRNPLNVPVYGQDRFSSLVGFNVHAEGEHMPSALHIAVDYQATVARGLVVYGLAGARVGS